MKNKPPTLKLFEHYVERERTQYLWRPLFARCKLTTSNTHVYEYTNNGKVKFVIWFDNSNP